MSFISQIMNTVKMLSNPKQAIDLMLSKMPNDQVQILREMMNSKSPQQAISEMAKQRKISLNQLEEAKKYYNLAKKFGIKIPNDIQSYIKFAKAFLDDKDAKDKAFKYYYNVVK